MAPVSTGGDTTPYPSEPRSGPTPAPEVTRDHLVRTVLNLFDGETSIVVVEGPEGIGKSTFLSQVRRACAPRAASLVVSSASRWAYDPRDMAADLAVQLEHYLTGKDILALAQDAEPELARLVGQLRRRVQREGSPFYFLLDGIETIPEADEASRRQLLALLPFGVPGFRFILSGSLAALDLNPTARATAQAYRLAYFSLEETQRYLAGLPVSERHVREVYDVSGGVPGKLATIRRLVGGGEDVVALLERLPEDYPDVFRLEWDQVDPVDELQSLLLAILSYESRSYSADELLALLTVGSDSLPLEDVSAAAAIERALVGLTFIDSREGRYTFVHEALRRFAAAQLEPLRSKVSDLFIKHLSLQPDEDDALARLPTYFADVGDLQKLVHYLSPERFAHLYQRAPSLKLVQRHAEQGIDAARKLKREDDLVRFTLQISAIEELAGSTLGTSEARALVAIGEYETARSRAEATMRIDDRLRLLAAIGRARAEQGLPPDKSLNAELHALFRQLEPGHFGRLSAGVASDLFHSVPDLAIELVSQGSDSAGGENSMDWALLRMAVQAESDRAKDEHGGVEHVRAIHDRIQHPAYKRLSMYVSMHLGRYSASQAIAEAERLDVVGDRLYLLRHWMRANRTRDDAVTVLEYGINAALTATGFTANASVFRQLALCLPYVKSQQSVSYFVGVLDSQKDVLRELGPAEEFIRLKLILARSLWRFDRRRAEGQFVETYNDISQISDPVIRAACVARLMAALSRLGAADELEELGEIVEAELSDRVDHLLRESADHFETVKGVVSALAATRPERALKIVGRINTEWRRDLAYQAFVESAVEGAVAEINVDCVNRALDAIVRFDWFDETVDIAATRLVSRITSAGDLKRLLPLLRRVGDIRDAAQRTRTASQMVRQLVPADHGQSQLVEELIATIRSGWRAIYNGWERLEIGYEIVAALAKSHPDVARVFVAELNELRDHVSLLDQEGATAALLGLSLSIRAYAGISVHRMDTDDDLRRLLQAIRRTGSSADQVHLLTELAVRCHFEGREDLCKQVTNNELVPTVLAIPDTNPAHREEAIIAAAPALYLGAQGTATAWFTRYLSDPARDEAIHLVMWTVLRRIPPSDPYDSRPGVGFPIDFEDTNLLLALMRQVRSDWLVYDLIVDIVDSILGLAREQFKRPQKAEVARQLEEIVESHFPTKGFIEHEGYLVAARAQVNRLRDRSAALPVDQLAAAARRIPNVSDRSYVLGILASTSHAPKDRQRMLQEAREVADRIAILADRIDRYWALSLLTESSDSVQSKELLRKAYALALQGEGETFAERRGSLIALAYRTDPDLAASLASMSDDDPAKARIDKQLELYRLRDAFAARRQAADSTTYSGYDYSRALWLKLGSLNARRTKPVPSESALPALGYAAPQPISKAYPIFAWFIENGVRRRIANQREVRDFVLPLFEACLRGAELSLLAAPRHAGQGKRALPPPATGETDSMVRLVGHGDRKKGIQFLKEWLAQERPNRLFVMDPYFGLASLELLALVREVTDSCELVIVTKKDEGLTGLTGPAEEAYMYAWKRLRDDEPPPTKVIFAGTRESGRFPVHDRWWFAEGGTALHLGTSFNGLGARTSKVRVLTREEGAADFAELEQYFAERRVDYDGEKMTYSSIML